MAGKDDFPEDPITFNPYFGGQEMHGDVRAGLPPYEDAFGTHISDITVNRIDIPGTYSANLGRHQLLVDGVFTEPPLDDSPALNDLPGKWELTATAGETIVFGSREIARYVPNYELLWGVAGWAETEPLESGHHIYIEFSDDDQTNGYAYRIDGVDGGDPTITLEQYSGGTTVDSVTTDLSTARDRGFAVYKPTVYRNFLNWYGAGLSRYTISFPSEDATGKVNGQRNDVIGRTATRDDVQTEEINLQTQIRLVCDAGASDLVYNMCSAGVLIRGNATEFDREKTAVFFDGPNDALSGGSIGKYPANNDALIAGRIDPNRRNVAVKIQPPITSATYTLSTIVGAVHQDNPDLTVNFNDPDDDGVDEGTTPAAQARSTTDVMQWTTDVTSFPTTTDFRADFSTGTVPDVRQLGVVVSEGGPSSSASATAAGELAEIKRVLYPNEVLLLIPRSDPNGNTSAGRVKWIKLVTEQDH